MISTIEIRKKIVVGFLVVTLVVGLIMPAATVSVEAITGVKIGQAASDERGKVKGGKAGDQTGKEVAISKWSCNQKKGSFNNWEYVFRAKDKTIAKQLAAKMIETCNNNHVGYDQNQPDRFSFYEEAKKVGWDIKKIEKNCETTCTSAISVCLNAVGIPTGRFWTVNHVYKDLSKTGKFYIITASQFTKKSDLLEPGDILLSSCHGAMVVDSPNSPGSTKKYLTQPYTPAVQPDAASTKEASQYSVGQSYQIQTQLNVRRGPGKEYEVKYYSELSTEAKKYSISASSAVLNIGTVVKCVGTAGDWIKTDFGWICGNNEGGTYVLPYTGTKEQQELYKKATTNISKEVTTQDVTAAQTAIASTATKKAASTVTKKKTTASTTKKSSNVKKTTTKKNEKTKEISFKKYKDYKLKKDLYVRSGPGTKYKILKKSQLTKDGKKHAKKGSKAILKKGTIVTCLEIKGNWMRIPSGWVYCKVGNIGQK